MNSFEEGTLAQPNRPSPDPFLGSERRYDWYMPAWTVLLIPIALLAAMFWLGMRWTRRTPPPADLRRADEAEPQRMPTGEEQKDRIFEAFGGMMPPDGF